MDLSIVTTLYYSAPYLNEFYTRIKKECEKITDDYEIIFVNDDSPDNSLEVALSLQKNDDKIVVIDLAKNYVHLKTIMAGLSFTKGDLVFLIDCDLEEEPELLGKFYNEMQRTKADVIYGQQERRKGGIFERVTGNIFYNIINFLSDITIPPNFITARLMTQRYVRSLVSHKERELYLGGILVIAGFKQVSMRVKKHSRGISSYTFRDRVNDAVNSILSFSNKPLIFIFYIGIFITIITFPGLLYLIIKRLVGGSLIGWTSLMVSLWFIGGLIIFMMGIIGMYLSKIFIETKHRPYVIIRDIYERYDKSFDKDKPYASKGSFIIT